MANLKGLGIYLNDHLGGSITGSELATKLADEYADTPSGPFLAKLAEDIEQDRASLAELMDRLGIQKSSVKKAGGWVAEKLSRLKLTDIVTGHESLKQMLQFETLALGVEGKGGMWRALTQIRAQHPELAATDLDGLIQRADVQRATLEEHRMEIAGDALTG